MVCFQGSRCEKKERKKNLWTTSLANFLFLCSDKNQPLRARGQKQGALCQGETWAPLLSAASTNADLIPSEIRFRPTPSHGHRSISANCKGLATNDVRVGMRNNIVSVLCRAKWRYMYQRGGLVELYDPRAQWSQRFHLSQCVSKAR